MSKTISCYENDFYAWTQNTAELLRQGRLQEIDIEHIAEELESMGKRDKREMISRLAILLMLSTHRLTLQRLIPVSIELGSSKPRIEAIKPTTILLATQTHETNFLSCFQLPTRW